MLMELPESIWKYDIFAFLDYPEIDNLLKATGNRIFDRETFSTDIKTFSEFSKERQSDITELKIISDEQIDMITPKKYHNIKQVIVKITSLSESLSYFISNINQYFPDLEILDLDIRIRNSNVIILSNLKVKRLFITLDNDPELCVLLIYHSNIKWLDIYSISNTNLILSGTNKFDSLELNEKIFNVTFDSKSELFIDRLRIYDNLLSEYLIDKLSNRKLKELEISITETSNKLCLNILKSKKIGLDLLIIRAKHNPVLCCIPKSKFYITNIKTPSIFRYKFIQVCGTVMFGFLLLKLKTQYFPLTGIRL